MSEEQEPYILDKAHKENNITTSKNKTCRYLVVMKDYDNEDTSPEEQDKFSDFESAKARAEELNERWGDTVQIFLTEIIACSEKSVKLKAPRLKAKKTKKGGKSPMS